MTDVEPFIRTQLDALMPLPRGSRRDWADVLERSNRHHRRRRTITTLLVVAAVGVLTASISLAATRSGWLTGEPAPPEAVTGFKQYAPQLGFHPEAGRARFVAQDGRIKLFVTANREGGICYLVDEPWKPANAGDGGSCAAKASADEPITAGTLGMSAQSRAGIATMVIAGRVTAPAARTIRFSDPRGAVVARPIGAEGFYVAAVRARPLDFAFVFTPTGIRCPPRTWEPTFVALDSQGNTVAEIKIPLARSRKACLEAQETRSSPGHH